jgi:hypothetical protein
MKTAGTPKNKDKELTRRSLLCCPAKAGIVPPEEGLSIAR